MTEKNKKVLIISYPFPPIGLAGSIRPFWFAKYLPENSWTPTVLTIRGRDDLPKDHTLLQELPPEVSVIRTRVFDPYLLYESFMEKRRQKKEVNGQTVDTQPAQRTQKVRGGAIPFLRKIKGFVIAMITTPDHQVFWLPFAVFRASVYLLRNRVDTIITTSPPHSTHLIGWILRKLFRIPWIADFRDPWTQGYGFKERLSSFRFSLEMFLEKRIMIGADKVIANTNTNREKLTRQYPTLHKNKFVTIHNGFEQEEYTGQKQDYEKFTITHTGIFYPMVQPYYIFEVLSKWFKDSGSEYRQNIQVLLVGDPNSKTREVIAELGLNDVVQFIDRVPQKQAMEIARASDLLLVSLGSDPKNSGWIPMKLYNYLNCNKPILAFLPEGEAANIVKETNTGYVIHSEDFEKTVTILEIEYGKKFHVSSDASGFAPDREKIISYEVKNLVNRLSAVMSEVNPQ